MFNFADDSQSCRLLSALPGGVCIKDKHSVYIACNSVLAVLVGYSRVEDVKGMTDYDVRGKMSEVAPTFIRQDQEIFQSGLGQENLDVGYYADRQLHIFLSQKALFRNIDQGKDAVISYMTELFPAMLNKIYCLLLNSNSVGKQGYSQLNGSYQLNASQRKYQLSSREEEVLFFLVRGWTSKEIAYRLKISPKTVETYVASSKLKMNCLNRSGLIEKSMAEGLLFNIPKSLILDH